MPQKNRDPRRAYADHRRRTQVAAPAVEEIEQALIAQLTPAVFAQARAATTHLNLRDRVLNLPAMCAIVLSIVGRQVASLSEILRMLEQEGLLWVEALKVSKEALSKRFRTLPAEAFASLFAQIAEQNRQRLTEESQPELAGIIAPELAGVLEHYSAVYIADASTLERLRKTMLASREQSQKVLGGKLLLIVDALQHLPVAAFYQARSSANEKTFNQQLLEALPSASLTVLDGGFFSFDFFDSFTNTGKFFLTRMRQGVAYRTLEVLSEGPSYRDEIIQMGLYSSDPCEHPVRMVSILWGTTWYRYISNELDDRRLSAQQLTELYRNRWRVEEAFAITKRLLGLSYLWVGGNNGVEIQIYATLIFYSLLIQVCADVAVCLREPLQRISVEMVFRSFYHYARARQRGVDDELIPYICKHAQLLGLVKAKRKRNRQRDAILEGIWQPA